MATPHDGGPAFPAAHQPNLMDYSLQLRQRLLVFCGMPASSLRSLNSRGAFADAMLAEREERIAQSKGE